MRRRTVIGGLGAATGLGLAGFVAGDLGRKADATALVAGSLQGVAGRVPGGRVEAHGSVAVRRLVLEDARAPDAVALADPSLFEGVAEEAVLFASNALVLAYRPDSPHASLVERDWRRALARAAAGRTDPALDPLGYRTVMAVRLDDHLDPAVLDGTEVLPETALLRTLEVGGLDVAFAYRSMAVEHDLPYVELPDAIDFSNPAFADRYRRATVDLGDREVRGSPIRYGAAALTDDGRAWVRALVEGEGRLREAGFGVPEQYPKRRRVDARSGT